VPTYAYACTACDHRFEVRQSFSDSALSECPECTGSVRKLFNTVGIVFKGSGFYATDSRKGSTASKPASSGSSDSSSGSSSGSSSSSSAGSSTTSSTSGSGSSGSSSSGSSSGSGSAA